VRRAISSDDDLTGPPRRDLYDEQVATYGQPDGTLRPLNYEELQTPLLRSFIREVLRMHPPIHSIMRKIRADLAVPPALAGGKNYVVPKGYFVLAAPGASHMSTDYWDQPQLFNPRRWFGEIGAADDEGETEDFGFGKISTGANSPYLPFGAGRHRCIGEQFAYVQASSAWQGWRAFDTHAAWHDHRDPCSRARMDPGRTLPRQRLRDDAADGQSSRTLIQLSDRPSSQSDHLSQAQAIYRVTERGER
jgi:cytochrome P450